jgi:hypothetical protein
VNELDERCRLPATTQKESLDRITHRQDISNMPHAEASNKGSFWLFGFCVVLLAGASTLAFLGYMGQGIAAGSLIGLPGREKEVLLFQQRATYWLVVSLVCEIGVVGFLAAIIRSISEGARASSFGVRLGCAPSPHRC